MQQRITCPNPVCPQPNDVQKVSAVVQSGITQGFPNFSSGTYGVRSTLSERLAEPVQPVNKGAWSGTSVFWMIVLGIVVLLALLNVVIYGIAGNPVPNGTDSGTFVLEAVGVGAGALVIMAWVALYKRAAAARFAREYPA